jgi:thioredoxin-related protein
MFRLLLIFLFPLIQLSPTWESNFDIAKQRSIKENKIILIHFVHKNRDAKIVKLEKVLFESSDFIEYANKEVVLLKVDLGIERTADSEKQFYHNSILFERFNNKMLAPYTIITDAEGKILKRWSHEQPMVAADFVRSIKESIEAHKQ